MSDEKKIGILIFKVDKYVVGIDDEEVIGVIDVPDITPADEKYGFLEGVTSFRDGIVPVIPLAKRWDISPHAARGKIIIVQTDETSLGLMVDSVEEVIKVNASDMAAFPDFIKAKSVINYFWAILKLGEKVIFILDSGSILNDGEKNLIQNLL